jgi:hypothetical protein
MIDLSQNTTYTFNIKLTGQSYTLKTLNFTTPSMPSFGGNGSINTSIMTFPYTGPSSPVVNADYSRMILNKMGANAGVFYSTYNGSTWSTPVSFYTPREIFQTCLSYKGDIGMFLDTNRNTPTTNNICTFSWPYGSTPTITSTVNLANINTIAMTIDGKFAVSFDTSGCYYSRLNSSTNSFSTFTSVSLSLIVYYSCCFNNSSTAIVCQNDTGLYVYSINNITTGTPSFILKKTYLNNNQIQRGLILVGGYYTTGIYNFNTDNSSGKLYIKYASFSDISLGSVDTSSNNLQGTVTFENSLSSFSFNDANIFMLSSIGYGNILYYSTLYNNATSYIYKITM